MIELSALGGGGIIGKIDLDPVKDRAKKGLKCFFHLLKRQGFSLADLLVTGEGMP